MLSNGTPQEKFLPSFKSALPPSIEEKSKIVFLTKT